MKVDKFLVLDSTLADSINRSFFFFFLWSIPRWRIGDETRFFFPPLSGKYVRDPQPLTFAPFLRDTVFRGVKDREERENNGKERERERIMEEEDREWGERETRINRSSRCALIVVLLELTSECCYEKAAIGNACLPDDCPDPPPPSRPRMSWENNGIVSAWNPNLKESLRDWCMRRKPQTDDCCCGDD